MNVAQHCGTSGSNCSWCSGAGTLYVTHASPLAVLSVQVPGCPHFLFLPLQLPWCPINSLRGVTAWSGWPFNPRLTIQFSYHLCHFYQIFAVLAVPCRNTLPVINGGCIYEVYTNADVKSWSVNTLILSMYTECVTFWYRGAWHWLLVAVHLPSGK